MSKETRKSSGREHATDIVLGRCLFTLSDEQFDTFARTLDEAPMPKTKLAQLISSKSVFEE